MFLKNLKLANFRNYSSVDINFEDTTLFIGKNAQGKSNLLESIYFLATTKSPKAERDSQLIKEGGEVCRVEGVIQSSVVSHQSSENLKADSEASLMSDDSTVLEIVMQDNSEGFTKRTKVNGVPRRVVDYLGNLVVILFTPEDINLITGPPSLRRWHLDVTLAQIDKDYKRAINEYTSVVTSRNKVLKRIREGISRIDELSFWTERLLINGIIITDKRISFFEFLKTAEKTLGQDFEYLYSPSLLSLERLEEYQSREIASASSLIGPHRDDFTFTLKGNDLAFFGSRGEQRTSVLDLKLLELEYINHLKESKPVLLLDDIFSELDDEHREHVISIMNNQQTILSAIENEKIPKEFLKKSQVIRVEGGNLKV